MARILICDDAIFIREVIREILTKGGHEVVGEVGDVEGVEEEYAKLKPDLVTMDLIMKESGVNAVRDIIKADKHAKIVIVSVLNDQEGVVVEAIRAGAVGIVTKPIKKDVLLGEIERVLKK